MSSLTAVCDDALPQQLLPFVVGGDTMTVVAVVAVVAVDTFFLVSGGGSGGGVESLWCGPGVADCRQGTAGLY